MRQSTIDDFVFSAIFSRRIKACMAADLITAEDLALLSVKAYKNANLNPLLAHMHHAEMTFDKALSASDTNPNFLGNAELKDYLKVSDCSQVSDGGAGVILCSEEGLCKLEKQTSHRLHRRLASE
jgi:acetyl-CoA acetyltransferase